MILPKILNHAPLVPAPLNEAPAADARTGDPLPATLLIAKLRVLPNRHAGGHVPGLGQDQLHQFCEILRRQRIPRTGRFQIGLNGLGQPPGSGAHALVRLAGGGEAIVDTLEQLCEYERFDTAITFHDADRAIPGERIILHLQINPADR